VQKPKRADSLFVFFLFVAGACLMSVMTWGNTHATNALRKSPTSGDLEYILYNFLLYYPIAALISLGTFHIIGNYKISRLTRPLQYTCVAAILTQLYGGVGYVGVWNPALITQCAEMLLTHGTALIFITVIQLVLFLNYWIDSHVQHIDKLGVLGWSFYNNRLSAYLPNKTD